MNANEFDTKFDAGEDVFDQLDLASVKRPLQIKNELVLDDKELSILQAFESGEFESVLTAARKAELSAVSQGSFEKKHI